MSEVRFTEASAAPIEAPAEPTEKKPKARPALPETYEGLLEAYENLRRTQSGSDAAYGKAAARVAELEKTIAEYATSGTTPEAVAARLEAIETGFQAKARRLELDYYARTRAFELGIDRELIDGLSFEDEPAIEAHLARLARFVELRALDEANRRILGAAKTPKAGYSGEPVAPSAVDQLIARLP